MAKNHSEQTIKTNKMIDMRMTDKNMGNFQKFRIAQSRNHEGANRTKSTIA